MLSMSSNSGFCKIEIHLASSEADPGEIDKWARNLKAEIEEEGLGSADLLRDGYLPQGAKSAEAITLGSVVLAVLPALVPKLVEFLQAYVLRPKQDRCVKVKAGSFEIDLPAETRSPEAVSRLIGALQGTAVKPAPENTQSAAD
jgi:hypothetical protein